MVGLMPVITEVFLVNLTAEENNLQHSVSNCNLVYAQLSFLGCLPDFSACVISTF